MKVRTRFAPSPTGFMHVGNLRTALYAYLFAKQHGGEFILRIEDTDLERLVPGAVAVIYDILRESRFQIDEGPNEGGPYGPYVQSERRAIYQKYARELLAKGAAYYCFCDKERLAHLKDANGVARYDKHCLHLAPETVEQLLASGAPYVIRQNMPTTGVSEFTDLVYGKISVPNNELEDNILIKSDGMPTYNFANVVDDHLMKISHVIRGNEYLSSTPKYNLLYEAFGWELPQYIHLAPIMKDETRKLSKRFGDANFGDFVAKGYLPAAIINYIALLGWSPSTNQEKYSLEELTAAFSLAGISHSGSIFDENKLRWLNGEYLKELAPAEFLALATPWLARCPEVAERDYPAYAALLQPRVAILAEIPEKLAFLGGYAALPAADFVNPKYKVDEAGALAILEAGLAAFQAAAWTEEALHAAVKAVADRLAVKSGAVYNTLRLAITAAKSTPGGVVELGLIFGRELTIARLAETIARIKEEKC